MNAKEELMYRIIDNCIRYCTIGDDPNSKVYITREKVLGKARHLNVVMTRAICVNQLIKAGFKKVLEKSSSLLAELNPQLKERQETDRRLNLLEDKLSKVLTAVEKLTDQLN